MFAITKKNYIKHIVFCLKSVSESAYQEANLDNVKTFKTFETVVFLMKIHLKVGSYTYKHIVICSTYVEILDLVQISGLDQRE